MSDSNPVFLYFTLGGGSCLGVLVLLYNLVSVVLYLREDNESRSSALAITAWGMGVLAMLLWFLPCVGGAAGLLAMTVARIERGRIYRDQAPLAGATPVRMANTNGTLAVVLQSGVLVSLLLTWIVGNSG